MENVECTSGTLYKSWVFTHLSLILAEHQKTLHLDTSQASAAGGPAPLTLEDMSCRLRLLRLLIRLVMTYLGEWRALVARMCVVAAVLSVGNVILMYGQ